MGNYIVCTAGHTKTVSDVSEFPSILLQVSVAFSTSVKKQKKELSYATHLHFHLHSNHKQLSNFGAIQNESDIS